MSRGDARHDKKQRREKKYEKSFKKGRMEINGNENGRVKTARRAPRQEKKISWRRDE